MRAFEWEVNHVLVGCSRRQSSSRRAKGGRRENVVGGQGESSNMGDDRSRMGRSKYNIILQKLYKHSLNIPCYYCELSGVPYRSRDLKIKLKLRRAKTPRTSPT